MKKIFLTLAAVPAFAIAMPAAAQPGYQQGYDVQGNAGFRNRIMQLEARLAAGVQSGEIDRFEARNLRLRFRDFSRLEQQYSRNGLSQAERADLQQRLRGIRQEVRVADNGRYQDNQPGRGGPYEETYADDYDDRNDNRYDSRDDSRYGNVETRERGLLGGIVDRVLGGRSLGVGQRVTGNLQAVPYGYGSRYRDSSSVYYRSDGQRIYEIDARTNTVIRVHAMNR